MQWLGVRGLSKILSKKDTLATCPRVHAARPFYFRLARAVEKPPEGVGPATLRDVDTIAITFSPKAENGKLIETSITGVRLTVVSDWCMDRVAG